MRAADVQRGGIGEFLPPQSKDGFGLKVIRLLKNGKRNENFWEEAKSIHNYCSSVRFLRRCLKIPFAAHYFLRSSSCRKRIVWNRYSLEQLFYGCFIKRDLLENYRGYEPISQEDLRRIYRDGLVVDLIMVYPVAYGGEKDLSCYYHEEFSCEDAQALVSQISCAILELYRCGTVHGDIKPENIIVSEIGREKVFHLTDFGSAHFEHAPSESGTAVFFDSGLYHKIFEKTHSKLEARLHTDFYALRCTLLALVLGRHPSDDGLCREDCVPERWPKLRKIWDKLEEIKNGTLTVDDFTLLAQGSPVVQDSDWEPFYSYCDEFDPLLRVNNDLEYGKLYEQISFSARFDPLMRIRDLEFQREIWKLFPQFYHTPLMVGSYYAVFHAPDDACTGCPPQYFGTYVPRNLVHARLSEKEAQSLMEYGKRLNEYFRDHRCAPAYLPEREDIFLCNGTLKLLWGRKQCRLNGIIDYEAYFRYLATDEAKFSVSDLLTLLPRLSGLGEKLDHTTCLKLLDHFRIDSRCAWLFGIESFAEKISGEKFVFDAEHWLQLRKYTCRFDDRIDFAMAWKMFRTAAGADAKSLLESPHIAGLLYSGPSPATDKKSYFSDFLHLRKWDKETFLRYFPADAERDFSPRQWAKCLSVNPALVEFIPEGVLPLLPRKTWVRILGFTPGLMEKCPCAESLSPAEWGSILLQQPRLKKYCPCEITFPERMKRRLDKKKRAAY